MTNSKATQEFVPIKEIRDGVVILKDTSMRSILMVSSLNFALKSPDEQQAIIMQFQNFLNSLDFSIEVCVQSREMDIRPYLSLLEERYKNELGDLMKIQIREYIQFIKSFTEQQNIMKKSFFIVVPFSQSTISTAGGNPVTNLFKGGEKPSQKKIANDNFEENRTQLEQRMGVVQQGLSRCGLRSTVLGTEEAVELFYKIFNPGDMGKPVINS